MLDLIKLDPFEVFERKRNPAGWLFGPSLIRLIDGEAGFFAPKVDVKEDEKAYKVVAELPGAAKDRIKVEVDGGRLTLSAEVEEEKNEEKEHYHVRERRFGSFRRVFTLPDNADAGNIEAVNKDGVLTITIPKTEEAKPKTIQVH